MNRQTKQLSIGVYFYNDNYRAFDGYPDNIDVWNSRLDFAPDYVGSPSTTSLSGVARANPSGYRPTLTITLDNSTSAQANKIRGILNKCANQYDRQIFATSNINVTTNTTFIINSADLLPEAGAYRVAVARNTTRNEEYVITAYAKANNQGTFGILDGNISTWENTDSVQIIAKPNLPSYLGVRRGVAGTFQYYTIEGGTFGIERELTIGSHIINLNLRGRERLNTIPTDAVL